ncbi:MAG TPA: hypothetical protein VM451_00075 [Candidatus Limnocylindria bacterium]|nr:hypothetical protein [Candidatus Limnocylindria bacterium]
MRAELLGVAGVVGLLLLAAFAVLARLAALDLPAACLDPESIEVACRGRQFDALQYQNFAGNWGSAVAYSASFVPPIAGIVLGIGAIAKELDQRTAVLAWSVGPSRRGWLLQRAAPLVAIVSLVGLVSAFVFNTMFQLSHGGSEVVETAAFDGIANMGFAPLASGISAFGITTVVGAMLGRLLPGLLAAGAFVLFAALLIQQGNDRIMAGESLVAEVSVAGPGRQVDWLLQAPDGRIISYNEAYFQYGDPQTGEIGPEIVQLTRYVPVEILPQVSARFILFHLVVGLAALTLAFAVVERRSP